MNLESLSLQFKNASLQEQIEAIKLYFQKNPGKFTEEDLKNALKGLGILRRELQRQHTNN